MVSPLSLFCCCVSEGGEEGGFQPVEVLDTKATFSHFAELPRRTAGASMLQGTHVPTSFSALIPERKDRKMGITLDLVEAPWIRIGRVQTDGRVGAYNDAAKVESRVARGDFLLAANEFSGKSKDMAKEIVSGRPVELVVSKPYTFKLTGLNTCPETPWGMRLSFHEDSSSLCILEVTSGGVISALNEDSEQDSQVRAYDVIIQVNSKFGKAHELKDELVNAETCDLHISRPACTNGPAL